MNYRIPWHDGAMRYMYLEDSRFQNMTDSSFEPHQNHPSSLIISA